MQVTGRSINLVSRKERGLPDSMGLGMAAVGPTTIRLDPALRALERTGAAIRASEIRLATGNRILKNGDDSASVSAASALTTQYSTLRSSLQNGAHATTLLQIAQHGLSQIRTILDDLSTLTATANEAGITPRQYSLLDTQFQGLKNGIDSIVARSNYNGANLLDGTFSGGGAANFQLGDQARGLVTITIPSVTAASLFPTATLLNNAANAATATTRVGTAQATVEDAIAKVAAYQSRLDAAEASVRANIGGVNRGIDGLLATDAPRERTALARNQLQQQTSAAVIAQALGINNDLLSLVR